MAADAIPRDTEFVAEADIAQHIAGLLREYMPGGIYIETGDMPNDIIVVSRGELSAGIFLLTVKRAEFKVADGD